jgi:hypothetical protein
MVRSVLNNLTSMNHIKIFTLLALLALVPGCSDDYLEIERQDETTDEEFMGTPALAQEVLNGAYDALTYDGFLGGNAQSIAEFMADNIAGEFLTNADWKAHYTWTTDIFLGTTFSLMQDGYRPVGRANYLIQNIDLVQGLQADERKRLLGEAKFIRAVCHFELVRLFAQPYGYTADNSHLGIPLRTEFGRDLIPRATVKEVYDQVIADLEEAARDLPASNGNYASSWAAKGYLAKVYFQMNRFQDAYDQANDVIENSGFALDTSISARFTQQGSPENVFALVGTDYDNDNAGKRLRDVYRQDASTGTAGAYISPAMFSAATVDPNDQRGLQWYLPVAVGPLTAYAFKKFPTLREEGPVTVPLVTITELKLIRAESAAELSLNLSQAAQDVEDIQARAGLVPNVPAEKTFIIEKAREQRRLELVGEGNRLHELKRQAVHSNPGLRVRGIAPWDCPGLVNQFPSGELQSNSEIVPNPTGGCQ